MSAHARALRAELRLEGVELYLHRGEVKAKGPSRALTAETYQKLTYFKEDLIELLWDEPASRPPFQDSQPAPTVAEMDRTEALFPGNVRVQIRRDGPGRWMLWFTHGAAWHRRRDFATPSLDHGRRTAEAWYGRPIVGWRVPEGADR